MPNSVLNRRRKETDMVVNEQCPPRMQTNESIFHMGVETFCWASYYADSWSRNRRA
jgi:hypothetical protein